MWSNTALYMVARLVTSVVTQTVWIATCPKEVSVGSRLAFVVRIIKE